MRSIAGRSGSPGADVRAVDARGKHLFIRFEGDLTLHSHLRMTGRWQIQPRGAALAPRTPARVAGAAHRTSTRWCSSTDPCWS